MEGDERLNNCSSKVEEEGSDEGKGDDYEE